MRVTDRPAETSPETDPSAEWERRKRRAEIFGDVLPDTTRDERDDTPRRESDSDRWLREQVPPHHGQ